MRKNTEDKKKIWILTKQSMSVSSMCAAVYSVLKKKDYIAMCVMFDKYPCFACRLL